MIEVQRKQIRNLVDFIKRDELRLIFSKTYREPFHHSIHQSVYTVFRSTKHLPDHNVSQP